jgi:predicted GNAT family acetyltransferase
VPDVSAASNDPGVTDVRSENRFVFREGNAEAELTYELDGKRLTLIHTGVPEALSGHGIGGRLVRASIARAAGEGLTIVPWCPFARRWLKEHPDAAPGVTIDFETPPPRK